VWVYLNDSFISIVADLDHPERLLVRARQDGDIEQAFPDVDVEVREGEGTDYPYRASLSRQAVADTISDHVMRIDYGNFKASIRDVERHDAYLSCWFTMRQWQQGEFSERDLFDEDPFAGIDDLNDKSVLTDR
jgi:hypothetical protein